MFAGFELTICNSQIANANLHFANSKLIFQISNVLFYNFPHVRELLQDSIDCSEKVRP